MTLKAPSLTIGIEEEYQIIDPQTRELRSYITQMLEGDQTLLLQEIKPELHQSIVEIGTNVCQTPAEARAELVRLRRGVMDLAGKGGLKIAAAGTHPFSSWMDQEITPQERYLGVHKDMQELAKRLLIFGTHVHVAIEDREFLVEAMNVSRYLLPHLLCLATSSPFWMGRLTGLKSYRSIVFRNFPRTGIPRVFNSWGDLTSLVDTLVETNNIPDGTKLWWDIRPNWKYPDAGTAHLRRVYARGRGRLRGGHLPGDHRQDLEAAPRQHDLPRLSGGTGRREQVARRALWPGRQPDRLRQARRVARPRPD